MDQRRGVRKGAQELPLQVMVRILAWFASGHHTVPCLHAEPCPVDRRPLSLCSMAALLHVICAAAHALGAFLAPPSRCRWLTNMWRESHIGCTICGMWCTWPCGQCLVCYCHLSSTQCMTVTIMCCAALGWGCVLAGAASSAQGV